MRVRFSLLALAIPFFSCNSDHKNDHPAYHDPAVQVFSDSIAQHGDDPQLLFRRAEALSSINQDSLALIDVMAATKLDSLNAQYLYTIGYLHLKLQHPGKAIEALKRNLDVAPGNVNVRLLLSKAYLANGDINGALSETNKVLAAAPGHVEARFSLAQIKAAQKDLPAAITIAKGLLAENKNNYTVSYQLADWYRAGGNPEAIQQYQQTFRIDTNNVDPLFEIGEFYQEENHPEAAKQAYRACIMSSLDYTDAYLQTGKILYGQDSTEKALRQFNIAISTAPDNAEAYLYKGLSFQKLNLKDSARTALRQALAFDPESVAAKKALKAIQ